MIDIARKKLKAAFILHLFSAMFVLLAFQNYGFLFINILFHFCLIWSLAQPSMIEPMVITGMVNILAIIFEVVFLSVFWPVMAVINLVARFISGPSLSSTSGS